MKSKRVTHDAIVQARVLVVDDHAGDPRLQGEHRRN